jgi:hypothetical protein
MSNDNLTPEEFAAAKAAKIERIRKGLNREVLSEYIRIGQSDLYDYEPVRRAVLKEIAFMQVLDEETKIPKDSPFKGQYEGWCYASQRFLANRVGTTEGYVRNSVALMEKDGVIETRLWKDHLGYPHQEYHVVEEVVTEHQRDEGFMEHERKTPRRGGNSKANKGSFQLGNKVRATAHDSRSHRTPQPNATAHDSRNPPHSTAVNPPHTTADSETAVESDKAVIYTGGIGHQGGKGLVRSTTASGLASAPSDLRSVGEREAEGVNLSNLSQNLKTSSSMDKHKGVGVAVKKPSKPLPNRLCYPEAFKNWRPGMRVPKCKRCKENLFPNENHVCEGYEPMYPTFDMEARQAAQEALREDLHDSLSVFHAEEPQ